MIEKSDSRESSIEGSGQKGLQYKQGSCHEGLQFEGSSQWAAFERGSSIRGKQSEGAPVRGQRLEGPVILRGAVRSGSGQQLKGALHNRGQP